MSKGIVFLAAGGTGGHLFPAEALAHALIDRGYQVHLVTDRRAERYAGHFPAETIHSIPSATIGSKSPVSVLKAVWTLWRGMRAARRLMRDVKPKIVVGFGGYPTIPPMMAAKGLGLPTVLHEQNAVMGRANKALAKGVRAIAGGFLSGSGTYGEKTVVTGNPVRPAVIAASSIPYAPSEAQRPFRLVVFGGSQGASFFSGAIPQAIRLLDAPLRQRLTVSQQARAEDLDEVKAQYADLGVTADIAPFFNDMAGRIAAAHLVISRSGASTVSELSVIGRPSLLVPYPYALDHDQAANAAALAASGGATVTAQSDLTPERLSEVISQAMLDPQRLSGMADSARRVGKPDATRLLADLVEAIAAGTSVNDFKGTTS